MPIQVWRPGDYRVCPQCAARHKVQDIKCTQCGTALVGTRVHRAAPVPVVARSSGRSPRALRAVVAAGVIVAAAAGLWVRSVFKGAALQDTVEASSQTAAPAAPAVQDPGWTPPVLNYPPVVGYNQGVPPSMAALTIVGATDPATAVSGETVGMTSIAPPSEPTRKTSFTDADLARLRGDGAVIPAPVSAGSVSASAAPVMAGAVALPASSPARAVPAAVAGGTLAEAAARVAPPASPEAREWISRVHDAQEDVVEAQAKVRRLEIQAESLRTQVASGDAGAREKAERDLSDTLDDLEKAERTLVKAQRDLSEAQERAAAAGARFER